MGLNLPDARVGSCRQRVAAEKYYGGVTVGFVRQRHNCGSVGQALGVASYSSRPGRLAHRVSAFILNLANVVRP